MVKYGCMFLMGDSLKNLIFLCYTKSNLKQREKPVFLHICLGRLWLRGKVTNFFKIKILGFFFETYKEQIFVSEITDVDGLACFLCKFSVFVKQVLVLVGQMNKWISSFCKLQQQITGSGFISKQMRINKTPIYSLKGVCLYIVQNNMLSLFLTAFISAPLSVKNHQGCIQ